MAEMTTGAPAQLLHIRRDSRRAGQQILLDYQVSEY
jgi:hypothetical protein